MEGSVIDEVLTSHYADITYITRDMYGEMCVISSIKANICTRYRTGVRF